LISLYFRFSQLKELIEKEMGVKDGIIFDDRGNDISTMHNDEIV